MRSDRSSSPRSLGVVSDMGVSRLMESDYCTRAPLSNPLGREAVDSPGRMTPADEGSLRKQLGEEIRRLRIARGYTLREAASRCGLSYQMLGQIEKNGQNTTIEKLEGIVRGLRGRIHIGLDAEEPVPDPGVVPEARRAIADRFLRVLGRVEEKDLDIFLHTMALWESHSRAVDDR